MNDIAVTVDTVVLVRNPDERGVQFTHVLLIKRKNPPFQDGWALPGGFLDPTDKNLRAGAERELREETGLWGVELHQVGAWGSVDRDPRGYTVTVAFFGVVDEPVTVKGQDDALEATWFSLAILEKARLSAPLSLNLAFDHEDIISRALLRAS